jgi:NAD(P)-dependent dehydrogenase (short-subunit alcohol dehydrogenase family)
MLTFTDRVVIVTGGASGLGKSYALEFARLGASVVVNDLSRNAESVASDIRESGGSAVACIQSVKNGSEIIRFALERFGRIDVLINNAGILRDSTFLKMTSHQWDEIMDVHLTGVFQCTHAVWPVMVQQQFGRIINVSSASGLYGNIGQANYSAAKSGLIGFTKSLAKEGRRFGINVNCVCPLAASQMTSRIIPATISEIFDPKYVAPFVSFLSHPACQESGNIFEVAGGWISEVRIARTEGLFLGGEVDINTIRENWGKLKGDRKLQFPERIEDSVHTIVTRRSRM